MTNAVKIIGLCGQSGSGKGYVSKVFSKYNIPAIDTDKVYRDILDREGSECLSELVCEFGNGILFENGKLDRRTLASIVFSPENTEKLEKLNEITHKYILRETLKLCREYSENGCRAVIIDAPVLFESGFDSICDLTVCVTAPESTKIKRICKRDGRSEKEAALRLASQKSEEELRERCTDEIVNDDVSDIAFQVAEIIRKYDLGGKDEK